MVAKEGNEASRQVADVIWPAQGKARRSLDEIADGLEGIAQALQEGGLPISAAMLRKDADALRLRHDHADPCDDLACPCRKAEADDWRQHGAVRY